MPRRLLAELWQLFRAEHPACCPKHDERDRYHYYRGIVDFHEFLTQEFEGTSEETEDIVAAIDAEIEDWRKEKPDLMDMKLPTERVQ